MPEKVYLLNWEILEWDGRVLVKEVFVWMDLFCENFFVLLM
jgi:hypothetical protein